jgi:hypothetical protein
MIEHPIFPGERDDETQKVLFYTCIAFLILLVLTVIDLFAFIPASP